MGPGGQRGHQHTTAVEEQGRERHGGCSGAATAKEAGRKDPSCLRSDACPEQGRGHPHAHLVEPPRETHTTTFHRSSLWWVTQGSLQS